MTSFVGREAELVEAKRLLAESRLLTLTGPGGAGKTRLSILVAEESLDQFPDGVYFVALGTIADAGVVAATLAQTLGVETPPGQPLIEFLQNYLGERQLLLVLDNFEQVLPAATVVAELLQASHHLKIVVTSRAALRLPGEQEFPVPPLGTPDPKRLPEPEALSRYAAVALFQERATAARPDFSVTAENAAAVAEICHRLDGLPLAIELAAARVKLFPPRALLARLTGAGLGVLAGGSRDAPERQKTLNGAIGWSYDLLTEAERHLFRELAAFAGGFTLEAVEAVCEASIDALDGLSSLMDKSLLRMEEADDGATRFSMLGTLREYALERLREADDGSAALWERHATYYLTLAEGRIGALRSPREATALKQFLVEADNVRAAIDWARENHAHLLCARLAKSLGVFMGRCGRQREALAPLEVGLEAARAAGAADTSLYGELLREQASAHLDQFAWAAARQSARSAWELFHALGDSRGRAHAANLLGLAARGEKALGEARAQFRSALERFQALDDRAGIAIVRTNLGLVEWEDAAGDKDAAREHWSEALRLSRGQGDRRGVAEALNNLGVLAHTQDRLEEAGRFYEEALLLEADMEHAFGVARALSNLGEIALATGKPRHALRLLAAAEYLFDDVGSPYRRFSADLLDRAAADHGEPTETVTALRADAGGRALDDLVAWAAQEAS